MSRPGDHRGLLDPLHASGCDGREFSTCRPVVVPSWGDEEPTYLGKDRGAEIVVIFMAWCEECGAADWEAV